MGIETVHNNELKHVVCLVTWRTVGRAKDPQGEPQVERMQLGVEVGEEEPDGPYTSRYFAPWTEAKQRIEQLHNTHQNFFEITSIEPECSCLGPCRYQDRTRFLIEPAGYQHFQSAIFDRDDANNDMGWLPIEAGTVEGMKLLLERHRRSNHHQ
ncbi:hypothetical protein [Streptomyces sp. CBMA156]|uniref:hypothetical protein n=1 Tax=Streptomyces sp. CBMA156 TaxID=1930280 RepID=UPI001661F3FA|nr:hypothetical protein [Streptomyces sp. CBMA156]MBD0670050.1 hypothetical protein [Streptomyces sp. CBMA156]